MYIENRAASALFKLLIGLLSVIGFWATILSLGASASRLLSTWVLAVSAIYFLIAATVIMFSKKRNSGDTPCATIEGGILINFLLCGVTAICLIMSGEHFPGLSGWPMPLIYATLPILVVCDWAIFNRKGRWHYADPCYWLALPAIYVGYIIYSAEWASSTMPLRYPFTFLNYNEIGIWQFLIWLAVFAASILLAGYIFFVIDFALSGRLAKHIVMLKLRKTDSPDKPSYQNSSDTESTVEKYTAVKIEPIQYKHSTGKNVDGIKRSPKTSTSKSRHS